MRQRVLFCVAVERGWQRAFAERPVLDILGAAAYSHSRFNPEIPMTTPHMQREIAEIPALVRERAPAIQDAAEVARRLFEGRRQWVTVGRGTSGHAAYYAHYLVTELTGRGPIDLRPAAIADVPSGTYDDAVVVALSASGQSTDVAAAAAAAKGAGAHMVGIANANGGETRLGAISDVLIDVGMGVEHAVPATKSLIGQMLAVAALAGYDVAANADAIARSIEGISDDMVEGLTTFVEPARRIVWIARGSSLGAAEDATLKTAETARRPAVTWSGAEVLHGPLASIGPEDRVVVMADGADVADSLRAAIVGLRGTGAPVAVVGLAELELGEVDARFDMDLPAPRWARALPLAVLSQRIALSLALRAGFDPDAPPGLNKVTLT